MRTIYAVIHMPDNNFLDNASREQAEEWIAGWLKAGLPHRSSNPRVECFKTATDLASQFVDYDEAHQIATENVINMLSHMQHIAEDLPTVGWEMVRILSDPSTDFDSRKVAIYETIEEPFRSDGYTVTVAMDKNLPPVSDFVEMWNKFFAHHLVGVYDMKTVKRANKTYIHFKRK